MEHEKEEERKEKKISKPSSNIGIIHFSFHALTLAGSRGVA